LYINNPSNDDKVKYFQLTASNAEGETIYRVKLSALDGPEGKLTLISFSTLRIRIQILSDLFCDF